MVVVARVARALHDASRASSAVAMLEHARLARRSPQLVHTSTYGSLHAVGWYRRVMLAERATHRDEVSQPLSPNDPAGEDRTITRTGVASVRRPLLCRASIPFWRWGGRGTQPRRHVVEAPPPGPLTTNMNVARAPSSVNSMHCCRDAMRVAGPSAAWGGPAARPERRGHRTSSLHRQREIRSRIVCISRQWSGSRATIPGTSACR